MALSWFKKSETDRIPLQKVTDSQISEPELRETFSDPFIEIAKSETKIIKLYKFPVKCPIGECKKTLGSTSLMSHVLLDHTVHGLPLEVQEVHFGKRTVIAFHPASVTSDNICLGILAYGGLNKRAESPVERGFCLANTFLPSNYRYYKDHLAILVMAAKLSFIKLFGKAPTSVNSDDQNLTEIFVWLVSEETSKPLHCIMTAQNHSETLSKSTLVKVNQVYKSHDPMLLTRLKNCGLHLSNGLCQKYTEGGKACLQIEMAIQEIYPDSFK